MEFYICIFRKSAQIIHVSLKSDKKMGTLREKLCTFWIIFPRILIRIINSSDKIVDKTKTHVSCPVPFFFFFFENRAVYWYEKM
jgi:hypothetical protein